MRETHNPVPSMSHAELERLSTVVIDAMPDGLVLVNMDEKITAVNPALEKMTGCKKNEVVGKDIADVISKVIKPEDLEKAIMGFRTALKGKVPTSRNLTLVTKDGREVSIISTTSFMGDAEGKPSTMILVFRDITERKKIEEKLRLFLQSVESAIDGIAMGSLEGEIIYANEAFVRMFGYSREELIGKKIAFIYPENQVPKLEEALKATLEGGWTGELVAKRKDGKLFPMVVSSSRVLDGEGKVIAHMASHRDVTERKKAEERIEHLNAVLRAISNVNQLIVRANDRDKLLQGICDNLTETRGYCNAWIALLNESGELVATAEAGLGKEFLPLVERLKRGGLTDCGRKALRQSDVVVTEDPASTCADCPLSANYGGRGAMTVRLEYGGKVYGLMSASIPQDFATDEEEQAMFKEVATDIAFALHNIELEEKHKKVEEQIAAERKKLEDIMESMIDGVTITDMSGKITYINRAATEQLGYKKEEIIGKLPTEFIAENDKSKFAAEVKKARFGKSVSRVSEYLANHKDGTEIPMSINFSILYNLEGRPREVIAVSRDITELKKAEEEKLKATADKQRMEELEKFAKIAVGRELKMVELKDQIKALELRLEGITEKG